MKGWLGSSRARLAALTVLVGFAALTACSARFTSSQAAGSAGSSAGAGESGSSGQGSVAGAVSGSNALAGSAGRNSAAGAAGAAGEVSSNAGSGGALSLGGASALGGGGGGGKAGSSSRAGAGGTGGLGGLGGLAGMGISGGGAGGWSPCTPALMIDDMEDGNDRNCPNQGRNGEWWSSTGTLTGSIDPPKVGEFPAYPLAADARAHSDYGMRLSGTGFGHADADWASIGFNLIDNAAYDLSPYQGLSFYAKSKAGAVTIHVEFATDTTTATSEGGACQSKCNDHWEKTVMLDGSWHELSVPFGSLVQEGWGVQPKDLAHTRFVYFGFLGTDGGPAAFDFLIDDVRLY